MAEARKLERHPIHLAGNPAGGSGRHADAVPLPEMPQDDAAMQWYQDYAVQHAEHGGRLVSQFTFTESWTSWEMHPDGAEVVLCTAGSMTIIQLIDDAERHIPMQAGEYAINPAGVWHTADVTGPATALFITPGMGTQHRPR